ncbi:MAG: formylglycine-generating enzyme family protein [Candidatus Competibacteraceae bacterium]
MHDLPRQVLCELLAKHGTSLCTDPRRCEALLRDYCGRNKREIFVLISALKERVATELEQATTPPTLLMASLAERLHTNLGLAEEFAWWAVESWALALGVISHPLEMPADASESNIPPSRRADRPSLPAVEDIHGWLPYHLQCLQQQTAAALGLSVVFRDRLQRGGEGPELVVIPAGRFLMGSPMREAGRRKDERQHQLVMAHPFALGRYPVTFAEYDRFASAMGRSLPADEGWGRDRRPVININWEEAVAYTTWLSAQTGRRYRLPTEAEWEYAARAGNRAPFPTGETLTSAQAHYDAKQTVAVGQYPANTWELHDMQGNVWEWTGSVYDAAYRGGEQRLVAGNADLRPRVLRGGSWRNQPPSLRVAFRARLTPDTYNHDSGFRMVREL